MDCHKAIRWQWSFAGLVSSPAMLLCYKQTVMWNKPLWVISGVPKAWSEPGSWSAHMRSLTCVKWRVGTRTQLNLHEWQDGSLLSPHNSGLPSCKGWGPLTYITAFKKPLFSMMFQPNQWLHKILNLKSYFVSKMVDLVTLIRLILLGSPEAQGQWMEMCWLNLNACQSESMGTEEYRVYCYL